MFGDIRGICLLAAVPVWSLPALTTWRRCVIDCEVYCVSRHSSNPLHLSHVASQPIVRTPAPRIVRRQEATTSRFIIVQHKQYEAILSCKCSVHTFSTLYNTWLFRTHHNQYLLSQLAPCRLTSHGRCSDASLRTNQ